MQDETRIYPLADHLRVYRDGRVESCLVLRGRDSKHNKGDKCSTWRPLRVNRSGQYPTIVAAFKSGRSGKVPLHKIVAWAWHGAPQPGQICRHLDDDKMNCHADNLRWGTHQENSNDAIRNGRHPYGASIHTSKLRDEHRDAMRLAAAAGTPITWIAKVFDVNTSTVWHVVKQSLDAAPASGNPQHKEQGNV